MNRWWGWFLGLDGVTSIEEVDVALAAPWAQDAPFWVFLAATGLIVLSIIFYLRWQNGPKAPTRWVLAVCRGLLLAILLLTLADPVLQMHVTRKHQPQVYVVFDGTDSMAISDQLPEAQRKALAASTGLKEIPSAPAGETPVATGGTTAPTRMQYIQSWLSKADNNTLAQLQEKHKIQLEAFVFDGNTTSQLRKLSEAGNQSEKPLSGSWLAEQLTTKGQVTALGAVLQETSQQFGSGRLAGVVLVSDFAHNAGTAPVGIGDNTPLAKLGVPIYAVGVGATEAVDLAVDLQTDPKMKKAERSSVLVKLRQSGLQGQSVTVRVSGRKVGGDSAALLPEFQVGQRTVTLQSGVETLEIPFTPEESGRFEFTATVDPVEGEIVDQNNHALRQVNIIDDYLRLMYVAHEPTWEWRFIKEVFHRDKLVGMDGFRTFLASSDPRVREANVLFLPTLTPKRSEFFANDVLFLDDMPRAALNDRFCEMVKEFVGNLGGGLVVITGPRFGPKEIEQTPLADLLPVIVDPQADRRDAPEFPEFRARLTPHAARYPFMQLGATEIENTKAWDNLGKLPWYQPVAALHEQAFALAEHPTDKCRDGKTPQPLISVRQYGKGEVVFLSFNETWRLRRKYGEKYYRQFWSQLIYRLGMSHALGSDKRFVARLDQPQYRAEDKVTLTVEAYDVNFEPLDEANVTDRTLEAELIIPGPGGGEVRPIRVPMLRKGVFEARIPVLAVGEYSLRVKDPVTGKFDEQRFEVTPLSAERRRAVRDEKLQNEIATQSGGKAYDLTTVHNLVNDLHAEPTIEKMTRNQPLWSTPLWFTLVVGLMLGEWLFRKLLKLS
ncbi:hypothetical protein NA78x_003862 [Anatilimnocola sp. NA78]|uniref:hypothetical protein n=1 Tax=Anatilimnocola sp. NA78 TaxID=3415683 RepID=UPI003CE541EF